MSLAIVLALSMQSAPTPEPARPGRVILLGGRARETHVPELASAEQRLVLSLGTKDASDSGRIDPNETFAGDARELDRAVRAATHIEVGPGPLVDWMQVLYPRRKPSALVDALIEAHANGATILARGDSAGLISSAVVIGHLSLLDGAHADPHDADLPVAAWPLGFQPWALFDEETRASGSLLHWLTVLQHEKLRLGVFLAADSALVVDRNDETMTARGPAVSLFVDARRARRDEGTLRGVRLTMLGDGDVWAPGQLEREAREHQRARRGDQPADGRLEGERFPLASVIGALSSASVTMSEFEWTAADGTRLSVRVDERTTVSTDANGRRRWADLDATFEWSATLTR